MDNFINILSMISLAIGSFFIFSGSLGLIKLPDVFSRIHAAGLIDTLGSGFVVLSLVLYSGFTLVSFKPIFIPSILNAIPQGGCQFPNSYKITPDI